MDTYHYKDILDSIPESFLVQMAKEAKVDYKVSKLIGKDVFNLLLYSVLEKDELSLRTIEENYKLLFNDTTRHSSISSRLQTININFFRSIFSYLSQNFLKSSLQKELLIIDSTTLQLSNKLLNIGFPCRNTKQGTKNSIKCLIATEGKLPYQFKLHSTQQGSGDTTLFRELILEHGRESICIFDRGLQKRKTFQEFSKNEIKFLTRGNDNIRYKIIKQNSLIIPNEDCDLEIIEDNMVNLCQNGTRFLPFEIRLIKARHKETNKIYTFLTNIVDFSADEICVLYKKRWSIEVFFRFIKQELNMKHFLGHNKNAIEVTLYIILIASILLIEYKNRCKMKSYKFARRAFMNELKLEIFKPIIKFCGGDPEKVYHYYNNMGQNAAF